MTIPDQIISVSPGKTARVTVVGRERPWLIRINDLDLEVVVDCGDAEPPVHEEIMNPEPLVGEEDIVGPEGGDA